MSGRVSAWAWRGVQTGEAWGQARPAGWRDRASAVTGLAALAVVTIMAAGERSTTTRTEPRPSGPLSAVGRDVMLGAYGGASYTHPSVVTIRNPGRTDLTVQGFGWDGQPFKSPVYYGVRTLAWPAGARWGTMLDFTHAKAIARAGDTASFSGTLEGKSVASKARIGDVFSHLEFSHGHNIVTLNGLLGLGTFWSRIRPYAGLGAGVSLPHTEIGFRSQNGRTYEYQYAGVVGQALAGLEVRLDTASVFFEYKFSYAPYEVPVSGVVNGWLLLTDLWRQLRAWGAGEQPPGGTLRTTLITQHGIAGVLVRVGRTR